MPEVDISTWQKTVYAFLFLPWREGRTQRERNTYSLMLADWMEDQGYPDQAAALRSERWYVTWMNGAMRYEIVRSINSDPLACGVVLHWNPRFLADRPPPSCGEGACLII